MPLLPPKPLERVCKRKGVAPTVNEATTPKSDQASVTPADNFLFEVNVSSDSVKNKEVETLNSMFFDKTSKEWKFRDSNMMPLPVEIEVHKPTLRNLTPKYKRELHRVIEKNAPLGFIDHNALPDMGAGVTCGGEHLLKELGISEDMRLRTSLVLKMANKPILGLSLSCPPILGQNVSLPFFSKVGPPPPPLCFWHLPICFLLS